MSELILLVDDEKNITKSISLLLKNEGYDVVAYNNGLEALDYYKTKTPDLTILDIKMPEISGIDLINRIKHINPNASVIFLTSKCDEQEEIEGLTLGADDYITKPFSQNILISRIKTILRRNEKNFNLAKIGNLTINNENYSCFWKDEKINLSITEFLILKDLSENIEKVKTREQLIDFAYGDNVYVEDRAIDNHIKRIRKKIKKIDNDFDNIETIYGLGYKYKS
jgi:two-component system response regulator ChvI